MEILKSGSIALIHKLEKDSHRSFIQCQAMGPSKS